MKFTGVGAQDKGSSAKLVSVSVLTLFQGTLVRYKDCEHAAAVDYHTTLPSEIKECSLRPQGRVKLKIELVACMAT